ncbi:MAG: cytochrome c3 family protein [Thermodesulfobacteriota bacterium]|nr:cytochrome c3 family protein [Thermodesulfobacteriota bacterium]
MTRSKQRYWAIPTVIIAAALAWFLSFGGLAAAGSYADSAHGNASYGVNRPSKPEPTGACAHCHETADTAVCSANAHMLFYGTQQPCDMVCFECHGASYASEQEVINYPYSVLFGGSATLYFESILHQFCATETYFSNCGSRHNLAQIWSILKNNGGGWGFGPNPNPCSGCHDPHLAQRLGSERTSDYDPTKSSLTRPSERYNNPGNLWGDDPSERMDQYVTQFTDGVYQAPYYGTGLWGPVIGPFEPAGDGTSGGSNLPDYVTFCLDCHQYQLTDPESGETIQAIDYASERHGGYPSNDCSNAGIEEGSLKAPYNDFPNSNYVLSCLDCHEPHGTPNRRHLIRRLINGQEVAADADSCDQWDDQGEICGKCHEFPEFNDHLSWSGCNNGCHGYSTGVDNNWHGSQFVFGSGTDNCQGEPSF